ncbi:MAG: ribonuclease III [Firmicutes bacterium]|nr:ribonuclease III [Bacillota bacterium]
MKTPLSESKLRKVEEILSYHFTDTALLVQALTHSSYSKEMKQKGIEAEHYERLEFLGDAVLEVVTSEMLFHQFDWDEGKLTKKRASIVCEESLSYIAAKLGLGEYLILSTGEEKTGGRKRPSILCDLVEALIGAVYLDGGMKEAKELIGRMVFSHLKDNPAVSGKDYKTVLQEKIQAEGTEAPVYKVICEEGPPHKRIFTVELLIGGKAVTEGTGSSKKQAQQAAAEEALRLLYSR